MVFKSSNSSDNWFIKSSCDNFIGYFYFKREILLFCKDEQEMFESSESEGRRDDFLLGFLFGVKSITNE